MGKNKMRGINTWILGSLTVGLTVGVSLLVVSAGSEATVWPIVFDDPAAASGTLTSNPYVVEPFLWRLEVNNTADDETLLANSDIELLCGDGDGCLVYLFLYPGATTAFQKFEANRLATSGSGPLLWKLFSLDGTLLNDGVTGDSTDEELLSLSAPGGGQGTRFCILREDLGRAGNFELAIGHGGLGPHSCLLRIED